MLARISRALREEALKWAKIETIYESRVVGEVASLDDGLEPFAVSFRLSIADPQVGEREFTVTIVESRKRR